MTERQAGYDGDPPRRRDVDEVEHIGDTIHRLIEHSPWQHLAPAARTNGNRDTGKGRRDRE